MYMTEAEIRMYYRDARIKTKQIGILADLNNCKPSQIKNILGIKKEQQDHIKIIRELNAKEMSDREISNHSGIPISTITNVRYRLGLQYNKDKSKRAIANDVDKIREMHAQGKTDMEIARELGWHQASLSKWMRKNGFVRDRKQSAGKKGTT